MIVVQRKPFDEIRDMIHGFGRVLIVGCGTCSTVCHAGGEAQVAVLSAQLEMASRLAGQPMEPVSVTVERQCDRAFFTQLDTLADASDAILSMGCGAGIQLLAEAYPHKPVFPAVDTRFVGITREDGWYEERCRCCGRCMLGLTAGVCPITMCAKKMLNGPCGGVMNGACEVHPDLPCAWQIIYDRLRLQGRLDCLEPIIPPVDWMDQVPASVVQPGFRKR
ncbi:MAG: methylenetetrahydrofolate reductase C-terminal domain-containing protein [Desulfobacterales bacterium]|nr:methylenetetrahydrofolate reductase C-terminal domain-containing protein [Desulfobacterales bacterium]MDD4071898.1 methylenetetrahydrofolate reductase C-terminal domain-containing protein [Desulfobacterales bacterium]MDD4392507.1 methylenetetrahydrofolate reductase C-terminal domain-containing protein [Desulfobacterales bacterium]